MRGARRWLLIVLAIVVGLPLIAAVLVRFDLVRHPPPPERLDRGALRAEIMAKRKRGEDIAVRSIADDEADARRPGVDFVAKGDSASLVVFDESTNREIGTFGTAFARTLHDDAAPGSHTYRFSMDQGSTSATVHVAPNTLTRVVIERSTEQAAFEATGLGTPG